MSSTLMSGFRKTILSGTTLTSSGRLQRGTTACCQQCPILALTLAPSLALPIAAVTIARRRSRGRGRPEDVIAKAKTPSPPPPSTDIVAAVAAIAAATVAAAAANATITTPSPFHPCLHSHYCCSLRQRHCTSDAPVDGWLLCHLSLLACCVVCRPNLPAPPPVVRSSTSTTTAIAAVNDCHCHCHSQRQRPTKASGRHSLSTVAAVDGSGGNDIFATAVNDDDRMVADRPSLPPPLPPPPMLPPPRPCPCLRRHHHCSLRQRHCPSNAPVDGWLLCRLSPLACCVVHRPNLSAPAVVRCVVDPLSAGLPSPFADHRQPLSCHSFTEHQSPLPLPLKVGCCVLRPPSSIPTTSPCRKHFQFPPSWTYSDLLRVSTCLVL